MSPDEDHFTAWRSAGYCKLQYWNANGIWKNLLHNALVTYCTEYLVLVLRPTAGENKITLRAEIRQRFLGDILSPEVGFAIYFSIRS